MKRMHVRGKAAGAAACLSLFSAFVGYFFTPGETVPGVVGFTTLPGVAGFTALPPEGEPAA